MAGRRLPRRGLILGAGGVLGSAWMIGALRAYEESTGIDVRGMDMTVGTSAGSVLAALIGLGTSVETMVNSEYGRPLFGDPVLDYTRLGSTLPPRPRMRIGSRRLLAVSARHPRSVTPLVALVSLLPQGRGTLAAVGDLVSSVGSNVTTWPTPAPLWIVAMDYDTGTRVVFGSPGAPRASIAEAVMASCAIPSWYAPVVIDGRPYVDGGTRSPTSVDLLINAGLDEVLVLAPACSLAFDQPRGALARIERQMRRLATRVLVRETELLRAAGTKVTVICPGPEDLKIIGGNVMDLTRRQEVFQTSLRTSAAALAMAAAGVPSPSTGTSTVDDHLAAAG
ncbi:patatin-like phospholipase family protein [Protofrankia symbiont of Coriaria ruscifolia]|uniref:patatin-like phospholipase family protein n=1 Tax=Protofrankia symbiont of Coriaria ruscifolia TaxID=1306542 RepID=UPI001041561B|nr:patatin-like phospholipase family protein [Protofrankia symbiont of Coriaria ruscifolia]